MTPLCRTVLAAAALAAPVGAHALITTWDGSSGLLPEQVDPAWELVDNGPTDPSFAGGVLTFSTSAIAYLQQYRMTGTDLDFTAGAPYWMEAQMRYVSGAQTAGWWRAPASMGFRFDNGRLAILEIRQDYIYIRNGDNSLGDFNDQVDTDGAFHTYRMEALGTSSGSTINVYQDGVLVLSDDSLYNSGGAATVFFGDSSILARGTTEWRYVSHNMAAVAVVPEPETYALMLAGLGVLGATVRRRSARPRA